MTRIAINGFGRIGRLFLRAVFTETSIVKENLEIVAINDLGDIENLAYLFKYDTIYGKFNGLVESDKEKGIIKIDGKEIKFISEKDVVKLPWKNLNIDIVVESTGVFESFEKVKAHIDAGAKRVVLTAPAKDADGSAGGKTILIGINDNELNSCQISSNASCTTNGIASVLKVLSENPGIEKAVLNTIHALTNTQTTVDSVVKGGDFRRGRASGYNIIPSTTGAAIASTRVIKELENKFDGIALRVPVITGSIADVTFISKRQTSAEEINEILKKASQLPKWQGILKTIDEQIVSSDIIGEPYAAIVDLKFTKVVDGNLVKIMSWYDNEWGYIAMLVKHVLSIKI